MGRSVATAFVTRTSSRTNKNVNRFDAMSRNNRATPFTARNIRLLSSRGDGYDDAGRRVRTPRPSSDSWGDDDDDWGQPSSSRGGGNRSGQSGGDDSWDDFDPWDEPRKQPQKRRGNFNEDFDNDGDWGAPSRGRSSGRQSYDSFDNDDGFDDDWGAPRERPRRDQRGGGRGGRGGRGRGRGGGRGGRGRGRDFQQEGRGGRGRGRGGGNKRKGDDSSAASRSINMNALEGAGFVHLYGLSSVLNALATGRRDLTTSIEKTDPEAVDTSRFDGLGGWDNDDNDDEDDFGTSRRPSRQENVKPQAQFRPYLFVLERRSSGSDRRGSKASAAQEVLKLAEERGVPIAHVDKGILNVLSGNRPHQGFALRCGKLDFESLSRIPMPTNARGGSESSPSLWLVLDEVVDPQNLGMLLVRKSTIRTIKNKLKRIK